MDADARTCFELFCDVTNVPRWVERVVEATVRREHGDGRPAEVEFRARRPDGELVTYALAYAYDRDGMRVSWRPREGADDAVLGYAAFAEDGEGCVMTYVLQEGYAWDYEGRDLREVTAQLGDAFAEFVATPR